MRSLIFFLLTSTLLSPLVRADDGLLHSVQTQWAVANYELSDKAKIAAFEKLIADMDYYLSTRPEDVNIWIWRGIVKSTLAGAKGGLGALSLAKAARDDLEHALTMDSKALSGSAYTSLGTLYHNVPGWPLGFGSDKKAQKLFRQALNINPEGIDPNYFYGEFLYDEGEYSKAQQHLLAARTAPPRADRPLADKGRQLEISALLEKVQQKLK